MEWILDVPGVKSSRDVVYGNRVFTKNYDRTRTGYETGNQHFNDGLYVPAADHEVWWHVIKLSSAYSRSEKEASLLKKAILDEDLPLEVPLLGVGFIAGIFGGGRISSARLLGRIRYVSACPELMEAGVHDRDRFMRAECMEAIGRMGKKAHEYAGGIADALVNEKNFYPKWIMATALRKIGNPSVAMQLRNALEDAIGFVRAYEDGIIRETEESRREFTYADLLVGELIFSILELDPVQGKEAYEKGLNDESAHVRRRAMRAGPYGLHVSPF